MLALADAQLRRKDIDAAIRLYEIAGADLARWSQVVDLLAGLPHVELADLPGPVNRPLKAPWHHEQRAHLAQIIIDDRRCGDRTR